MKQLSILAANAFHQFKKFKRSNTQVIIDDGIAYLYLFDNLIAKHYPNGDIHITSAGWFSVSTKERLNSLDGVHIIQRNSEWFLNGKEWNGEWTKVK